MFCERTRLRRRCTSMPKAPDCRGEACLAPVQAGDAWVVPTKLMVRELAPAAAGRGKTARSRPGVKEDHQKVGHGGPAGGLWGHPKPPAVTQAGYAYCQL